MTFLSALIEDWEIQHGPRFRAFRLWQSTALFLYLDERQQPVFQVQMHL